MQWRHQGGVQFRTPCDARVASGLPLPSSTGQAKKSSATYTFRRKDIFTIPVVIVIKGLCVKLWLLNNSYHSSILNLLCTCTVYLLCNLFVLSKNH